jgi:hypothetical protein
MNIIFNVCMAGRKKVNKKETIAPTKPLIYEDLIPVIYDFALGLSLISCFKN